ncbi:glycosyl hydrolase [Dictyobacter aurantiacus]|uniref:Glycosyl hydrolase n=1 Tax=Dictyobacter aurantiacus TaxID=1936993 RepID=A0A401ZPG7_9CHLR|nr:glycoside hydrolase family 125 protein [Dictyobacter aurantiacus]GCE08765.1 glycosyl hydrolase [Dictyobacter aurantiacus]
MQQRLQDSSEFFQRQGLPDLKAIFSRCMLNTLETTVELLEDGTTFVVTGDIPAMWLRDSTAQVKPYLTVAADDKDVQRLVRGLLQRQVRYILHDPYANAFNREPGRSGFSHDHTEMTPLLWERKYELDSLCYPLYLLHEYVVRTRDTTIFDETIHQMLQCVIDVMCTEQQHDLQSPYYFERDNGVASDTLPFQGRGTRCNFTGMVWSGFRPSDDACKFGYLVPANMFAVVVLRYVAEYARSIYQDEELALRALRLREEINFGIQTYAIVQHPVYGSIYAYETDGYGNYNLMDDANVPSLLSLPYLGYCAADDPIYLNTRRFILSAANPYYFSGTRARGIGSPHTPHGYIWPIALSMQGLTATDEREVLELVQMLVDTTAGTGYMHESFHPDEPERYTRSWFAWANSLFGEFIYHWITRNTSPS